MGYAVIFPGQGSQFPGMGAELFARRSDLLGERADTILGWSLEAMCLQSDEETLTRTEHAQPALFALSYALFEELLAQLAVPPAGGAGHSLGEYTALAAAGVVGFDEGLAIVAERGRAMAGAAGQEDSGMAALLGVDGGQAEAVTLARRQSGGRLFVANLNAPGQVVVAGGEEDLEWLEAEAANHGVRRIVRLKVSGGFHSPFMAPAADRLEAALAGVEFNPSTFAIWSNVSATPHEQIPQKFELVRQTTAPVRFSESLVDMAAAGFDTFVHLGPGEVTLGMAKRSIPAARHLAVPDLGAIPTVGQALGTIA